MRSTIIELTNDFHNTSIHLRVRLRHMRGEVEAPLSRDQIRRAKKKLCGNVDCCCSDDAGARGGQRWNGERLIPCYDVLYSA